MPSGNFVVNITVINHLQGEIYLVTPFPSCKQQGTWTSNPPVSVVAGGTGKCSLTDSTDAAGCIAYTYLSPLGATTTFQFTFGCSGKNLAQATAMTPPPSGGAPTNDFSYAVPFVTSVGTGSLSFCPIAPSGGSPFNVTFHLYNRITSVAATGSAPVLNWGGNPVPTGPIWTPGVNYNDGNEGSTNPVLFYGSPSTAGAKFLCMSAMVIADLATENQGGQVTLHAPMLELISNSQMMFQSDSTSLRPVVFDAVSVTATPVNLYCAQPSQYPGLACISSFRTGPVNWVMHTSTVVGAPQVEIYWSLGQACQMWTGLGGVAGPGGVWVRTLRDVFRALVLANDPSVATSPWTAITKNCFQGSPINSPNGSKIYDETGGNYGGLVDVFNLVGYYTASRSNSVNCADQAAFLQVCLGSIGAAAVILTLQPFGFLNTTYVVGNPNLQCNSPDYLEIYGTTNAALTVPNYLPTTYEPPYGPPYGRIWWEDHILVQLLGTTAQPLTTVLDATLGPYVADSLSDYLTLAVDTSSAAMALYTYWSGDPRPKVPANWQNTDGGPIDMTGIYIPDGVQPNTGLTTQYKTGSGMLSVTVIAPPSSNA